ncbi:MAG: substrate-binding domain-containing protein [Acidimicrobiales bacterium]|nr:substrate-binding domain-containing protein [Acidimicrobiales bacterium]
MTRTRKTASLLCVLGLAIAACGGDDAASDTTAAQETTTPDDTGVTETDPAPETTGAAGTIDWGATLADGEYGESYDPDPAQVETGMAGPSGLPTEERARNIALAAVTRSSLPVDQDLAFECWQNNGCETGTGGELKVGLADGFGGNVARQLFKMEFILQALTYPEIGEIGYTDANLDTQKAISDVRSFAARDFDIIISYPDAGEALVPAYRAAMEQGAKVITWSGTKVGEPGADYFTYTGPDVCAVAKAWGTQFGEQLPDGGKIAILLGAPGNTLDPLQEECMSETLPDNIEIVARQGDAWSRESYLKATSAILAEHPDLDGILGSYADAFVGSMRAFEAAGISMDGMVTMHQSDDNPFMCAWKDAGGVSNSWTSTALLMEGRTGLTAAMMSLEGYDVPAEIIFGGGLKQVTDESCRTDIPPDGSPSSLVPAELQTRMFPE